MAVDIVRGMLQQRRGRTVAEIMGAAEAIPGWKQLPEPVKQQFKAQTQAAVNAYHDIALDLLKVLAGDDTVLINEDALVMIRELHTKAMRGGS